MTAELAALAGVWQGWIMLFAVVFLRVGAAAALLPLIGERWVPVRVRLILALGLAVVVAPVVAPQIENQVESGTPATWFLLTETLAGLLIGAALRLVVLALQTAGSIAAQSTSLAQILGGAGAEPLPALGHLLLVGGLALAATLGLHVHLARFFAATYDVIPAGQLAGGSTVAEWGVAAVAQSFSLAFSLAAPFVVAVLVYNIALGAINRAMPQLMVSFVGAPAVTAGGLLMLFALAPAMLSVWMAAMDAAMRSPFGAGQ